MNHHHPRNIVGETGHGTGTVLAGLPRALLLGRGALVIDPLGELVSEQAPPSPASPPAAACGEAACVRIRVELVIFDVPEAPDDL